MLTLLFLYDSSRSGVCVSIMLVEHLTCKPPSHHSAPATNAQDWQVAKKKQDLHLDNIEKSLSTLKGIGEAMGETLKTQDVLIDTIDTKVSACLMQSCVSIMAESPETELPETCVLISCGQPCCTVT